MQALSAAAATVTALLWVPVASRLLSTWATSRKPVYLGFLGVVLWFIYHNTLSAICAFGGSGTGVWIERAAELLVLFYLYISLRKTKPAVKVTNGVNHN